MKRIVVAFFLGAFIVAAPVAAKVITVANPMSADLDGGGYNIANVGNVTTQGGAILDGSGLLGHSVVLGTDSVRPPYVLIFAGSADPSVAPPEGNNPPGSLYLRQSDPTHGQLWFKVGSAATAWSCVTGC